MEVPKTCKEQDVKRQTQQGITKRSKHADTVLRETLVVRLYVPIGTIHVKLAVRAEPPTGHQTPTKRPEVGLLTSLSASHGACNRNPLGGRTSENHSLSKKVQAWLGELNFFKDMQVAAKHFFALDFVPSNYSYPKKSKIYKKYNTCKTNIYGTEKRTGIYIY